MTKHVAYLRAPNLRLVVTCVWRQVEARGRHRFTTGRCVAPQLPRNLANSSRRYTYPSKIFSFSSEVNVPLPRWNLGRARAPSRRTQRSGPRRRDSRRCRGGIHASRTVQERSFHNPHDTGGDYLVISVGARRAGGSAIGPRPFIRPARSGTKLSLVTQPPPPRALGEENKLI